MEVQCPVSSADIQSEDDQGGEMEFEEDPVNWQSLVSRGVLASLTQQEIKRQEVINGKSQSQNISESDIKKKFDVYIQYISYMSASVHP